MADFDLAVIGTDVVGTAVARDAAGRGLSVLLLGSGDLASGASFGKHMVVRNTLDRRRRVGPRAWYAALQERAIIHATAPHLARAIGIVLLPQDSGRAPLSLRAQLFACDHLARHWLLPSPCKKTAAMRSRGSSPRSAPQTNRDLPARAVR